MVEHPSEYRLAAWLAGDDPDTTLDDHVTSCDQCQSTIESLKKEREAFLGAFNKEAFVDKIWQMAHEREHLQRRGFLLPRWGWAAAAASVIVAIVTVVLVQQYGTRKLSHIPDYRYKGYPFHVTVIVMRNGRQFRETGTLTTHVGDKLSVELRLLKDMRIAVGFLEDTGAWMPLWQDAKLQVGAHYSQPNLIIEDRSTAGWLIAGPPDKVKDAIKSRTFEHVKAIRIQPESSQP